MLCVMNGTTSFVLISQGILFKSEIHVEELLKKSISHGLLMYILLAHVVLCGVPTEGACSPSAAHSRCQANLTRYFTSTMPLGSICIQAGFLCQDEFY